MISVITSIVEHIQEHIYQIGELIFIEFRDARGTACKSMNVSIFPRVSVGTRTGEDWGLSAMEHNSRMKDGEGE